MKKLFTILAIALTVHVMGQVQTFEGLIDKVDTSPLKVGTVVLAENGGMRNATFAEELLFLIQEYEEDCYNDSTETITVSLPITGLHETNSRGYAHMKKYAKKTNKPRGWVTLIGTEWHHKEPTFNGFAEWLKNK